MKFLKSAHLAPTLVVTLVGFLLSMALFTFLQSLAIAAAVFFGQLSIGWSNDLVDAESDRAQNRLEKPLVNGSIKQGELQRAILVALPLCVLLSIFGPLHLAGGFTHLLGVGCGVAYNFYFKSRVTSPLRCPSELRLYWCRENSTVVGSYFRRATRNCSTLCKCLERYGERSINRSTRVAAANWEPQ